MLSGNSVLASDVRKKEFRAKHPKVVAIEMEAAGIATAATQYDKIESTNLLMVKSFHGSGRTGPKTTVGENIALWRLRALTPSA